jgi:subtilisin family serine protease
MTPDDTYYPQWSTDIIAAPTGWDITTGSDTITVAVVDTGFALGHQEFNGRFATNSGEQGSTGSQGPAPNCTSRGLELDRSCNNLDDDGNGFIDDWRGWDFAAGDNSPGAGEVDPSGDSVEHGTLVAGIIGATGNNGVGIAGLNWRSKILPLQALSDDGVGYTSTVGAAMHYAVDRGAKVISLSLGSSSPDEYLRSEVAYAQSRGVVVVAAAGNDGCNCMLYPANLSDVIAVGASDSSDRRAGFSSFGANLDLLAPGTTGVRTTTWNNANRTAAYTSTVAGTSISTPFVSGLVSLLFSRNRDLSASDITRILVGTADKVVNMAGNSFVQEYGYGRMNARAALIAASLAPPGGQLLSKQAVSLSSTDLKTGPILSSTCWTIAGASCEIILNGPEGAAIKLGPQTVDERGGADFEWSAKDAGLSPGLWTVSARAIFEGQSATSQNNPTLTVTP